MIRYELISKYVILESDAYILQIQILKDEFLKSLRISKAFKYYESKILIDKSLAQ